MTDVIRVRSFDGMELACRVIGAGKPLLLLHGLFSNATVNWIRFGHAALLADAGFAVHLPDLRAHGESAAPQDVHAYPADVLARDVAALVAHFGWADGGYDLGGFSLGARTVARAVVRGLQPRRLVLAGMGLEGLRDATRRQAFFLDAIARRASVKAGDPAYFAVQFMRTMKIDPDAVVHVIRDFVDMPEAALAALTMPTAVVCGSEDDDNGSASALTAVLPAGQLFTVPGTHMSSVAEPALGAAIRDFLTQP